MKHINAVIVDDEENAIQSLMSMLEELCPMVSVLGTACTFEEGIIIVEQVQPQIIFLDIEMPPHNTGFEFLRKIEHLNLGVIFTTAFEKYAINAINEFQPWAYLLKPIKSGALIQAIHIATVMLYNSNDRPIKKTPRGIILNDKRKGSVVILFSDLLCCLSDGPLTIFHYFSNEKIELFHAYRTLKEIEEQLPKHLFCRVHHGAIVNMSYVRRFERVNRSGKLHLDADLIVEVSVQKMDHFSKSFNLFLKGDEMESYPKSK